MNQQADPTLRLRDCACRSLRMTTRAVTQYYDDAFRTTGLKATQFALLNDISAAKEGRSIGGLAGLLLMDQTTVTRNIEILRKKGLVSVSADDGDLRRKRVEISEAGREKLREAMPLWRQAQARVQQAVGQERYEEFLQTLSMLQKLR